MPSIFWDHRQAHRPHPLTYYFLEKIILEYLNTSTMALNEDLIHGWVSTNCGRGTSDILWSCLTTIFLCVWTVIHLPVPCCSRFDDKGKPLPGEPSRSWRNWIIRLGIVPAVISVIAPEFLTVTAIAEFLEARRTQKKVTQINWTLTHAFFVHMGVFALKRLQDYACSLMKMN